MKLLKLEKIYNLELTQFTYEIIVESLTNIFTNYFYLIATIRSYNTRQARNKKNGNVNETLERASLVEEKLKLGR